ncbi:alpha/beta fold hydrolase [Streptacidiphilus rugosus]|uniref:alpha/beta fold hydrolase n=1 Tax=Streptacidiphilus rugosus TaxID=405783 RepID=UPI0018DB6879|nr:alpha/beta hydrolase [Streptacidiphilus rugosus]
MTNIVLVHGLWADGSSWDRVIPLLEREGHRVTAVQLQLASFEEDIAYTARVVAAQDGPAVLAGHSYGGGVITGAASRAANAKALVYVAALAPEQNEAVGSILQQYPDLGLGETMRPDAAGYISLDRDRFASIFAGDVDADKVAIMAAVQKPANGALFEAVFTDAPAWRELPSWYVVSTGDLTLNPEAQRFMAERIGATVAEVDSSHVAMVSHPEAVTKQILEAARRIG